MELQFEIKDGKKYLRCLIRKRLFLAKPEEQVRQMFVYQLLNKHEMPEKMLWVERRLSEYGIITNDRADIIVDFEIENRRLPLIIVECKNQNVPFTYKIREQIDDYNSHLKAKILGMSNGIITQWFSQNKNSNEFEQIENLPTYKEILLNQGIKFINYNIFHSLNEKSKEFFDVPNILKPLVVNMSNLLLKQTKKINLNFGNYEIKDSGIRIENNGNASGKKDWIGEFRVLNIIDLKTKKTTTISFRIFPFEIPYLVASYDNGIKNHNSLQLNFRDWISLLGNKIEFWHDGTMTVGDTGRVENIVIFDKVSELYPELIIREKVFLGQLDISKELTFEDEDVKQFFQNFIKYVICREKISVKIRTENKIKKQNKILY